MAHPHPPADPLYPQSRESHLEWTASAYYSQAMQLTPAYESSSYHPSPEQVPQPQFAVDQPQHQDQVSLGHASYAMQYSNHHAHGLPAQLHHNHGWVEPQQQQQQQQQQQHQHQRQQQQHSQEQHHNPRHHDPQRQDDVQGLAFVDPSAQHAFATSQIPASMILAHQRNQSSFLPTPDNQASLGHVRSRSNLYPDVSGVDATQMLFDMGQYQFQMDQSQQGTNQVDADAMYQINANIAQQAPSIVPDSPQSYRTSMDSAYSVSAAQDAYMQGYVYYPSAEQNMLQPGPFTQVGLDMVPEPSAVNAEQLSPDSSLSDHSYVVHTPDSLLSFTGAFETTAISNPGIPFTSSDGSYRSHHSGPSITSASPHDIWQQPTASPEIVAADESDDLSGLSQSLASSVSNEDAHSSRGQSSDGTPWPRSPEITRAVANANRHHRRRSSVVPSTTGSGVQKTITKKTSVKKDAHAHKALAEKLETTKVGRRKGPLTSDQRRQAGEIRKLKACIRCKFLKKTCDPNSPCAGCKPSHARLWMVPCTRLDIRELHYFMDDWKIDYERHVRQGITVTNIIDYSPLEQQIFIGHGFGDFMSISVREVYVRDDDIFRVDWVETIGERPETYEQPTSNLVIGRGGLSDKLLRDYLDRHVDRSFERFVEQMFEGTKVWTELLLAIHTLYQKTRNPMLRNALKFFVAYNLTQHITYEESAQPDSVGTIGDVGSTHTGKTLAPVLLNYEIKIALASIWRELHKTLLADLSTLFSSVYNGQKQKHWAMIMLLSAVLLMVWEEMQFDSFYRMERSMNAVRFCHEMEAVPVGVITGLFSAISQKMPSLREWDSKQHRQTFGGQEHEDELCEAVEKARDTLHKHESYLKKREKAQFDECDFDSLCNKFVHKILLRPA